MTLENKPNRRDMERHIELLTEPWADHGIEAAMEIRCLKENRSPVSLRLKPLDAAFRQETLSQAMQLNEGGWNIYVCVNPIRNNWTGAAKDEAIVAAYFAFADADDSGAAERLVRAEPSPDFVVHTGSVPHGRLHAYWRIEGIPDLEAWRDMQSALIARLGSDPAIKNPSRVMRLAGTLSHPDGSKTARGYLTELTRLKERAS
jgi:hypothetical protein